jgi:hypothetical protein
MAKTLDPKQFTSKKSKTLAQKPACLPFDEEIQYYNNYYYYYSLQQCRIERVCEYSRVFLFNLFRFMIRG